ncbi:MAG: ABC transporter permease, partial [Acidobacteriota bacterium]
TAAHLILPAVSLATIVVGRLARLVRSSMLEVLGQDYVRTARAKGVSEPRVLAAHALKNAAIPVVTLLGLQFAQLLGGAVVTETIFAWPGIGRLIISSITVLDRPVIVAYLMMTVFLVIMINLLVDILYSLLDPRVRLGEARA